MGAVGLDDTKWRELAAKIAGVGKRIAKVGIVGTGASATSEEGGDATIVEIAAFNELGTSTIPERSFIRRTFETKAKQLGKICERAAKAVVTKGMEIDTALEVIGQWGAAAVKRTITSGDVTPPDAPATIAAKGSSKPLVDTGQLVNAITYELGDRIE